MHKPQGIHELPKIMQNFSCCIPETMITSDDGKSDRIFHSQSECSKASSGNVFQDLIISSGYYSSYLNLKERTRKRGRERKERRKEEREEKRQKGQRKRKQREEKPWSFFFHTLALSSRTRREQMLYSLPRKQI